MTAADETRRAAGLGVATGARCFVAPAALALRGRLGDGRAAEVARFALPALALGEMVADKLPTAPGRVEAPGLLGRVVSGALTGHSVGGARGARVGAAVALASTYPTQALRAAIVNHTPLPDFACALPEDLAASALALAATGVDGPKTPLRLEFSAHQRRSAAGVGVAALVGVGAMSSVSQCAAGLARGRAIDSRVKVAFGAVVGIAAAAVAYEAFSA